MASRSLVGHRIHVTTLADLLLTSVDRWGDRPVLIFPDRRSTYAEFAAACYRRASALASRNVGAGDHVGILMANCIEYLELVIACALLGAVAVPVNARFRAAELRYVLNDADLDLLITSDLVAEYADFAGRLNEAFPDLVAAPDPDRLCLESAPRLRSIIMLSRDTPPPGFVAQQAFEANEEDLSREQLDARRARVQLGDAAVMIYTSGTTANPKGCPLSHGLLVRNGVNMNRERFFLTETDVFWAPLPMFHMASILPFIACLDAGAAMSSMTHVDAATALHMLERDRVTVAFPSFPTVTNDLLSHADFPTTDLSALRRINNVAPVEMLRRFQRAFPQAVQTGAYGLTEAGGVIAFNHPDESLEERLHTCGVPFPGISVRITDPETLQELPVGQQGEMWIRGYCVFDGYYKADEKNAESFHDGWFRTGDRCSLTEQGAVCYHGRIKDMLKVGGENVAALEIESHLAMHPAVQLAQVIGRPDDRLQEVPVAFVERVPGTSVTGDDLIAHCRQGLASFKVPREVYFVVDWPMSATKVQKFRLREQLPP